MCPIYIETHYIIKCRVISSHMGSIYIKTLYIISSWVISSHMGRIYIETAYTCWETPILSDSGLYT